jgi:TonB family protein
MKASVYILTIIILTIVSTKTIAFKRTIDRSVNNAIKNSKTITLETVYQGQYLKDTADTNKSENRSIGEKSEIDSIIFINPETLPIFKYGGDLGLRRFIMKNLKYPSQQNINGIVFVGFTVDTLGNVKDIEIFRGLSKETDSEVIRIVKMLTFYPGRLNDKPIEVKMVIPIHFLTNKP